MSVSGAADGLALLDLVEPPRWQRLQDHFARVLGVAIRTISPTHELLVNPSWPSGVEEERLIALLKAGEELSALLPLERLPRDTSSLTTPLGITYAAVPIHSTSEQVISYFVVGPMVVGPREDESQFRQRASGMGVDAQVVWPAILSLQLYTFAGISSALNLLEEVGNSLVQLTYQSKQLSTILPLTSRVGQAVVSYHTDRIFRSLLEAAALATKAEGGSVMVYDRRSDSLQIKAARGLSDAVIANTRLKRGEGLAGLAASRREVLLVDADTSDVEITNRLARRELVSSLVAPLTGDADHEPIGVLNLRTTNSKKRFTQEHVELLRQLLDLAGAALSSLQLPLSQTPRPDASQ